MLMDELEVMSEQVDGEWNHAEYAMFWEEDGFIWVGLSILAYQYSWRLDDDEE